MKTTAVNHDAVDKALTSFAPLHSGTYKANRVRVIQHLTEVNAKAKNQGMADLPSDRVKVSRVFTKHFNLPVDLHFGGLWEAGIKSLKSHLKEVIGNTILTYEEFVTLVTQVEAFLISRPLTEIYSNPNDSTLTPDRFLVGTSIIALPEPDLTSTPIN
ncbi:uncharacterized protein TNCV_2814861 [Trichonephila clavipes]|nr:uncharacterized protein TNCV_2814861 [Trichonephila clavipes]